MKSLFTVLGLAAATGFAMASVKFNELMINPPAGDNGFEFFELKSTSANESLSGYWILVIEGDFSANGQVGLVDTAVNLTPAGSTGSNGLALIRDSQTVLSPAPNGGTTVYVEDFNPDVENGTVTMLLVQGFSGNVGQDLDADGDGILETTPWTSVEQAIAWTDGGATDVMFANQFGGTTFPATGWGVPAPQAYALVGAIHAGVGVGGTNPGPYTVFSGQIIDNLGNVLLPPANWTLTPGSENMGFTATINATSYIVQAGLNFGGSLASLHNSDNDKVVVLCDEFEPTGQVEVTFSGIATASTISAKCEMSSSRNDCSQFTRAFNFGTSTWTQVDFRITTLADSSFTAPLAPASSYLSAGTTQVRVTWIPTTDIDSGDGWTYSIDQIALEIAP